MATRKTQPQTGARHFGLTAPYALAGSAAAPQQEPTFETEMAKAIRLATMERQARLAGVALPGMETAASPQPQVATVQDQIALSQEARSSARDVADLARQQSEAAQAEVERLKEQAGGAYEAGKQEALTLWQMIDERDARHQERMDAITKELREANEARRDSESARVLSELKAQMDAIQGQHEREVAELKRRAEQAEARAAEAAKPKSRYEQALDLLRNGEDPQSPAVRALLGYGEPGQETPQERWQRLHMDKVEDEIVDERARRRALQTNAIEHDAAVKAGQRKIYDHVDKAMNLLEKWLEGNVGGGGNEANGKAGLPHNGFGGTMEEMAAQAQQIAAAQAAQAAQQGGAE
jgi:hypothetical protein